MDWRVEENALKNMKTASRTLKGMWEGELQEKIENRCADRNGGWDAGGRRRPSPLGFAQSGSSAGKGWFSNGWKFFLGNKRDKIENKD